MIHELPLARIGFCRDRDCNRDQDLDRNQDRKILYELTTYIFAPDKGKFFNGLWKRKRSSTWTKKMNIEINRAYTFAKPLDLR